MKKTPGPRAPPVSSRPSLKMTARSYSWAHGHEAAGLGERTWTTFITKKSEMGREAAMRNREMTLSMCEHMPGPSSQAGEGMTKPKPRPPTNVVLRGALLLPLHHVAVGHVAVGLHVAGGLDPRPTPSLPRPGRSYGPPFHLTSVQSSPLSSRHDVMHPSLWRLDKPHLQAGTS
jgi:hypothetical protein